MSFTDLIRQQDLFAIPVRLTFRGKRSFQSLLGGLISILFIMTATAFLVVHSLNFFASP